MENKYLKLQDGSIFKIGNPNRRHYIIKSITAKRYLGYSLIKEDLLSVSKAIKELKAGNDISDIFRESLTFYIIILYGKCFADADHRHTKLNEKQLKGLNLELRNLHKELIKLRNQHIAHAGSEQYSKSQLLIEFDTVYNRIYTSHLKFSSFNFNLDIFDALIHEIINIVDKCAEDCFQNIKATLNNTQELILKESFLPSNFKIYCFDEIKNERINLK